MSLLKYRREVGAGAFVQRADTTASSFTGISGSSLTSLRDLLATNATSLADLTVSSFTGAAGWRGISNLNSGVVGTSVSATAARSGAVIGLTVYNYLSAPDSFRGVQVTSVGAGFFNVSGIGSIAPTSLCYFSWSIVR